MSNLTVKGNASGTGTVILEAPNTNSNRTITLPDSTSTLATTADVAAVVTGPTLGTAVASTSGTSIDFTGIPSTAKRVTVMLNGVSTNGTSTLLLRLGTSSGFVDSGYLGASVSGTNTSSTSLGVAINAVSSATGFTGGSLVVSNVSGNTWVISGTAGDYSLTRCYSIGYYISLAAALDRIRITTGGGTETFDAGTINISWE